MFLDKVFVTVKVPVAVNSHYMNHQGPQFQLKIFLKKINKKGLRVNSHFWVNYTFKFKCMHFESLYGILVFWKCEHFSVSWFGHADISIERSRITRSSDKQHYTARPGQLLMWQMSECGSFHWKNETTDEQKRGRLWFCHCFLRRNNKSEGWKGYRVNTNSLYEHFF